MALDNIIDFQAYNFDVNKEEEQEMRRKEFAEQYADERIQERLDELDTYTLDDALELGEESDVAKTIVDCLKFSHRQNPVIAFAAIRGAVEAHLRELLITEGEGIYDQENGYE